MTLWILPIKRSGLWQVRLALAWIIYDSFAIENNKNKTKKWPPTPWHFRRFSSSGKIESKCSCVCIAVSFSKTIPLFFSILSFLMCEFSLILTPASLARRKHSADAERKSYMDLVMAVMSSWYLIFTHTQKRLRVKNNCECVCACVQVKNCLKLLGV